MTVHAVELVSAVSQKDNPDTVPSPAPPSVPSVMPDRVADAISGFTEVLPGQATDVTHIRGDDLPVEHITVAKRFDMVDSKSQIIDALEAKVVDLQWYEIRYHECTHDDPDGGPCPGWNVERSSGSVPSAV